MRMAHAWGVSLDKLVYWRDPDIEDALPGWTQLTDDQKDQVRAFVKTIVEASGGQVLPRGESTPAERRAIETMQQRRRGKRRRQDRHFPKHLHFVSSTRSFLQTGSGELTPFSRRPLVAAFRQCGKGQMMSFSLMIAQ